MPAMSSRRPTGKRGGSAPARQARAEPLPGTDVDDRVRWITRAGVACVLVATVVLVCYVRLRLSDVPLERDEGEYAYAGQLILKGIPPYQLAYNMKFPGAYYAYAGLMAIFGQTPWGIRTGLLAVNLATMLLLFAWGRRLVGFLAAGVGASVFALLALDQWSMGVFAHATHFVALFVVGALATMHGTGRAWRLIAAGFLMGAAIAMKQQAVFFAALAVALAMWSARSVPAAQIRREALRRGALVAAGLALSFVLLLATLAIEGVLGRFWFWTFQYAAAYVSQIPLSIAGGVFQMAWSYITQATGWFWYAGLAGLVLLFASRWTGGSRVAIAGWFAAAALSVVPGFFFRPHYFIVLMPVVGLLAGVALASVDRGLARWIGAVGARVTSLVLFAVVLVAHTQRDGHFFFRMTATELVRAVYQTSPFLESPEIGRYLNEHTAPDDRIAVLGSEPQILFYANRLSATGYIYMYALTEPQPFASRMRAELMHEVESARPAYVVLVDAAASWVANLRPDTRIVTWANAFTATCYERVGIADIGPVGNAIVRWDAASVGYQPQSKSRVSIFRRQSAPGCSAPPSSN